jgi:Fic family protein
MSPYFERQRATYYDLLLDVTLRGEWEAWLMFFLQGVILQSQDAIDKAGLLQALRDDWNQRVRAPKASALLPKLIEMLFETPLITIPQAAEYLGITYPAARNSIDRLVNAGILIPTNALGTTRGFVAQSIVEILQ